MRRSGLGRGLGALIPNEVVGDKSASFVDIPTSNIRPNPRQPRSHFDEESLAALTASIREVGVLQPVLVRAIGDDQYELIVGERRWRAARRAGLPVIPAIVRVTDEVGSMEQALIENLHREDLNPLEEAVKARNESGGDLPSSTGTHSRLRPPGILELENLLSQHLDTRVKVDMGSRKGRVVIEFGSLEDLERIYRVMTEQER